MNLTLEMLLPLAGILAGARIAALISRRLGMPAVFGELLLGLMVGPALLNWVAPSETMQFLADIGVIMLMFLAGLETDAQAIRRVGKASFLAAAGGVILPVAAGYLLGIAAGLTEPQALFLGVVLTATSVSVSAQTLREMGKLSSPEGATIISAALIDDVLGVILFSAVMSLVSGSNLLLTLGRMAIFLPLAWLAGNWLLPRLLKAEKRLGHHETSLAVLVALVLLYAWSAEALGSVATITGAYILGTVVGRHIDHQHPVQHGIANLGYGFFIPIFFVNIGLHARLDGFLSSPVLTLALIAAAILTKLVGAGLGAHLGNLPRRVSILVGCGMVSRGEVALVIAGAGLSAGLLTGAIFSTLIVVTLTTTLITPILLRIVDRPSAVQTIPIARRLPQYAANGEEQA